MIVVDVETTGVDAKRCSLLSVGALDFDNPTNQFYLECCAFDGVHVEKEALVISGFTEEEARDPKKKTDREVAEQFLLWMKTCTEWTLAGQNPSFDRNFLEETAHRYHINWPLAHRTIDLHTVAYTEFLRIGKAIPLKNNHSALNLDRILEHVGLPTRAKKHNALEDTKLEAEAFSRLLHRRNLLLEYKGFSLTAD
ncbi:MAG TPA: 3'-5' exonuclease [Candidatus Paceibacterota bacterium]